MIKIKNRNQYDIIYSCLAHCLEYESSNTFPNTRSRFNTVMGGNTRASTKIVDILIESKLIELNSNVNHYTDVFKITPKGEEYIEHYRKLTGLLAS